MQFVYIAGSLISLKFYDAKSSLLPRRGLLVVASGEVRDRNNDAFVLIGRSFAKQVCCCVLFRRGKKTSKQLRFLSLQTSLFS
jgi:hypothetical protein